MSYYDHATMMAHKLGPWADDREIGRVAMDKQRRGNMSPAISRALKRMLQVLARRTRARNSEILPLIPRPVPVADGDAPGKS